MGTIKYISNATQALSHICAKVCRHAGTMSMTFGNSIGTLYACAHNGIANSICLQSNSMKFHIKIIPLHSILESQWQTLQLLFGLNLWKWTISIIINLGKCLLFGSFIIKLMFFFFDLSFFHYDSFINTIVKFLQYNAININLKLYTLSTVVCCFSFCSMNRLNAILHRPCQMRKVIRTLPTIIELQPNYFSQKSKCTVSQ